VKHPGEDRQGLMEAEEGFPVVDAGADLVPHILPQYS
jgi:hypothetical protein